MKTCLHLKLSKLADTTYQVFPSFQEGFRFYKCADCGQLIKAQPAGIQVIERLRKNAERIPR